MIEKHLNGTSESAKVYEKSWSYATNIGTLQGDAISPILFTIHLEARNKKLRTVLVEKEFNSQKNSSMRMMNLLLELKAGTWTDWKGDLWHLQDHGLEPDQDGTGLLRKQKQVYWSNSGDSRPHCIDQTCGTHVPPSSNQPKPDHRNSNKCMQNLPPTNSLIQLRNLESNTLSN